jgi:hypothetical protein
MVGAMTTSDAPLAVTRRRVLVAPLLGFGAAALVESAVVGVALYLKSSDAVANQWEAFAIAVLGGLGCANPVLLMLSGGLIAGQRTRGWGFGLLAGSLVGIVVLAVLVFIGFTRAFAS